MRIGIYARVSTERQETENQLTELREFAKRQGWEVAYEFIETVSGSGKKERPQFDKMMLAASQRKFDLLLFWALDRLSREGVLKTVGYLEKLKGWGIGWRSYTQPFFDTGNEMVTDIVLSVLAAVAKQERITISERTKAGLRRARAAGKTLGHPRLAIDNQITELRASGLSLRVIAKRLKISLPTVWSRTKELAAREANLC
jgi:DNA invertase Pin-like site-specific DNA recombinase